MTTIYYQWLYHVKDFTTCGRKFTIAPQAGLPLCVIGMNNSPVFPGLLGPKALLQPKWCLRQYKGKRLTKETLTHSQVLISAGPSTNQQGLAYIIQGLIKPNELLCGLPLSQTTHHTIGQQEIQFSQRWHMQSCTNRLFHLFSSGKTVLFELPNTTKKPDNIQSNLAY